MITRLEKYIRELQDDKLSVLDTAVIKSFQQCSGNPLTEEEIKDIENMIKTKNVNVQDLMVCYRNKIMNSRFDGRRHYNATRKKISECISNEQYKILENYFRGLVDA